MTLSNEPTTLSFHDLMCSLQTAGAVCIWESFSDLPRNAPAYAHWAEQDYVRVLPDDRGDGIARIRIEPTVKGRDARNSQDWHAVQAAPEVN